MKRTRKALATAAIAATLTGGLAGVLSSGGALAGAAEVATGTVSRVSDALSGLVSDGTITQAQADAVKSALADARPERGPGFGEGRRGPGGPMKLDAVAGVLDLSADELRTQLQAGQTLADIAATQGVATTDVIDALVAGMRQHLAEEVAAGEHTQEEADQKLADATARAEAIVNGEMPARGPRGFGGPGHRGPRGFGGHALHGDTTGTTAPGA